MSSWAGENRIVEDDLVGTLPEAAGTFKGLMEESLVKRCFGGSGKCVSYISGFCKPGALTLALYA